MPSGQEMDWAYSTAPGNGTGSFGRGTITIDTKTAALTTEPRWL